LHELSWRANPLWRIRSIAYRHWPLSILSREGRPRRPLQAHRRHLRLECRVESGRMESRWRFEVYGVGWAHVNRQGCRAEDRGRFSSPRLHEMETQEEPGSEALLHRWRPEDGFSGSWVLSILMRSLWAGVILYEKYLPKI